MKRHLHTHSRRRYSRPTPPEETSNSVIEEQDAANNAETIVPDSEIDRTEVQPEIKADNTVNEPVQFPRDPLDTGVREGTNTLYVVPLLIT